MSQPKRVLDDFIRDIDVENLRTLVIVAVKEDGNALVRGNEGTVADYAMIQLLVQQRALLRLAMATRPDAGRIVLPGLPGRPD